MMIKSKKRGSMNINKFLFFGIILACLVGIFYLLLVGINAADGKGWHSFSLAFSDVKIYSSDAFVSTKDFVKHWFSSSPSTPNETKVVPTKPTTIGEYVEVSFEKIGLSRLLGFKGFGFWDLNLLKDMGIGLLAGLWIWIVNILMILWNRIGGTKWEGVKKTADEQKKIEFSWLFLIGGRVWKIVLIGVFYAILYQIPLINRFFQIITFEFLGLNWFFRSIIFSFYIGFGPAAIERYYRYKVRMKYYKQIMGVKYGIKNLKAISSG